MTEDRVAAAHAAQDGTLPALLGVVWTRIEPGRVEARMEVGRRHMAPTGYLHAASIVALADSACGFGSLASLPEGATGFTTAELKSNFLGTAREGAIAVEANIVHGGRTTQVWDAAVRAEATGRTIALFRCTQFLLRG